jgi:hypothetical protein
VSGPARTDQPEPGPDFDLIAETALDLAGVSGRDAHLCGRVVAALRGHAELLDTS